MRAWQRIVENGVMDLRSIDQGARSGGKIKRPGLFARRAIYKGIVDYLRVTDELVPAAGRPYYEASEAYATFEKVAPSTSPLALMMLPSCRMTSTGNRGVRRTALHGQT